MIEFNFQRVLNDWFEVTYAPDGIEYTIKTGEKSFERGMYRIQAIIALYECTTHQIPSAEHPSTTMHSIQSVDGDLVFSAGEIEIRTSYDELRTAMTPFLKELFTALDEMTPSADKRNSAFRRISTFCITDNFENTYDEIMAK